MRIAPAVAALLLTAAVFHPANAQDVGEGLSRWVKAHEADVHALLEEVVNINSGTDNHQGVRAVGAVFLERLAAIGFDAEWLEAGPTVDRAGHVRAVRRGSHDTGRTVLLIGHLDTVFEEGDPFDRFVRDGNTATGPGVADDKGGVVVLVSALEALHHAGGLDGATVTVLLTGDEESVGRPLADARAPMVQAARASDVVLSFERGFIQEGQPYATIARRGSSGWTLTVEAKQAHSGRIFSEADGVGAINEVARIIHRFYSELAGEEYLTFNVGTLVGGTEVDYDGQTRTGSAFGRTNVIPSHAVAVGDLRTISLDQLERTRRAMEEIVSRHLPQTQAEITFRDGYPAMTPRDTNYRLLAEYSAESEALGLGPILALDPGLRGAGDIAFASGHIRAALDGLGPQGGDTHGPGEWVDLTSFGPQILRAAALIHRLTHQPFE
ncbi:MAG: M20/M25/M40 family metallo-hydrolase [Gemmatimonadetes bacterium]|nr:M20/M25/M40 family metallo-hydrolase [Gemmatimonadota bacterium]